MYRSMSFVLLYAVTFHSANADPMQNRIRNRIQRSGINANVRVNNSDDKRNDVEGYVWEYKVIDPKTKKTNSVGKLRVKGTAVFALPSEDEGSESSIKTAIANRIAAKASSGSKADRIGDVVFEWKKRSLTEVKLRFDKDDPHELSGIAVVNRDKRNKGGVWLGYYIDSGKQRWRFEMRRIED